MARKALNKRTRRRLVAETVEKPAKTKKPAKKTSPPKTDNPKKSNRPAPPAPPAQEGNQDAGAEGTPG